MINIQDKSKCCGCTACMNACPQQCIEMTPDKEGFLYPVVNTSSCIECGNCEQVCPIIHQKIKPDDIIQSYVLRTKSIDDLMKSTSGGFTTPLADWIFQNGGKVWAATYDEHWEIRHAEFNSLANGFDKSRGSKYVQSYLGDSFAIIKNELNTGIMVCFIGTPCQVYGLKNYLRKEHNNLITVDLVCHGTPSPKLWNKYLDNQIKKYRSKIKSINFRNKTYGYHSGTMFIEFENGKEYTGSARVDFMLKSFFSEIASRPCCYSCAFKHLDRVSDFTIFDCWHANDLVKTFKDDDRGYTNLIIQSRKGKRVFEKINNSMIAYPVDVENDVRLDGCMVRRSAKPHVRREEFYYMLEDQTLSEHIQNFIPITSKDRLIERSKRLLYKVGLVKILRTIIR